MISKELYTQILDKMPICCIDFVLVHEGKVLLVYRTQEPAKDQWWIPGGRVFKGEKLEETVKRKAKEELGIEVEVVSKIGVYEYFSDKNPFEEIETGVHSIPVCFVVKPVSGSEEEIGIIENIGIKLDETSSRYRWINHIEEGLDPYVKTVLRDSGIFSE